MLQHRASVLYPNPEPLITQKNLRREDILVHLFSMCATIDGPSDN